MATREEQEPAPLARLEPLEEGDFHVLGDSLARDPQYNDRRLQARRKLGAIGKAAQAAIHGATGGAVSLLQRTSLHQPHAFNHMRVRRLWAYLCRDKPEKTRLKRVLGPELGADLDAAYRNAYLCAALEEEFVETSLRIHRDAWYDGQNLLNRLKKEGLAEWLRLLNTMPGWRLRMDDWKGEWPCGKLDGTRLEEYLRYYKPGDHALVIEKRVPAPRGARGDVLLPEFPQRWVGELVSLAPLYRYMVWSRESDHLLSR